MSIFIDTAAAVISEGNSSTDNLAVGNSYTFTGTGELTRNPDLMVNLYADQATTIQIQLSQDGTNWDSTMTKYGSSGFNEYTTWVKGYRYVRVVVTTASLTTTVFRLQTQFGQFRQGNLPLNVAAGLDADSQLTRPTNYHYEVALGRRGNTTTWNKWGYNLDVDLAAQETLCSFGGLLTILTTASTLDIVSTSTDDVNTTGTGAWSVVVYGIDANRISQIEVIALNGTTPVTTANSYLGVNRIAIYAVDTTGTGKNIGTITGTATTGGSTQAQIPIGDGSTQQAFFFVQAGHTALLDWIRLSGIRFGTGTEPVITFEIWVTSLVSRAQYLVFRDYLDLSIATFEELRPSQPFIVAEKSIIEVRVATTRDNSSVSGRFSLIEVKNI
jgi:hypothetical protein